MVATKPELHYTRGNDEGLETERRKPDISDCPANEKYASKTETMAQRNPVRNIAAVLREYGGACGRRSSGTSNSSETGVDGD